MREDGGDESPRISVCPKGQSMGGEGGRRVTMTAKRRNMHTIGCPWELQQRGTMYRNSSNMCTQGMLTTAAYSLRPSASLPFPSQARGPKRG